ncbi:MAG: MFS transporter [Anaerotruncus sp.]|nr:MFS transporter [Anaerotruncus sp.]
MPTIPLRPGFQSACGSSRSPAGCSTSTTWFSSRSSSFPSATTSELTHAQEATLLGVALGGSGVGGILFGYLSDRFGRRHVMTWTILLYSVGTGLTGFATGFWSVLGFRLLTGLGVGGEWAVGHALLAESTPQAMRGRASALLQAGEPMGVGLAAVMGFLVAPVIGWRLVFFVSSASALIAFVVRTPTCPSPRCGRASATTSSRRCRRWRCSCGGAWSASP